MSFQFGPSGQPFQQVNVRTSQRDINSNSKASLCVASGPGNSQTIQNTYLPMHHILWPNLAMSCLHPFNTMGLALDVKHNWHSHLPESASCNRATESTYTALTSNSGGLNRDSHLKGYIGKILIIQIIGPKPIFVDRMGVGRALGGAKDSHGVYEHFAHQASRFGDLYFSTYFAMCAKGP